MYFTALTSSFSFKILLIIKSLSDVCRKEIRLCVGGWGCPIGCWRARFSWSSPLEGLSCWSASCGRALWLAAGRGSERGWRRWWDPGKQMRKGEKIRPFGRERVEPVKACRTSRGVLVVGVVSEALEEALEGDGLIDTLEFLSPLPASLLPFTCRGKH